MLPELFFNGSIVKHRVCTGTVCAYCCIMTVTWWVGLCDIECCLDD